MKKLKVLNNRAGLGGNRKLWNNVNVTAVENNKQIAEEYQRENPNDKVIITDGHEYLLINCNKYDFVWDSPPCQTHSKMVKATRHNIVTYPDMSLYQVIIFLTHFYKGLWVVENVVPYYEPLIKPTIKIGRHLFWSNFTINPFKHKNHKDFIIDDTAEGVQRMKDWLGIQYEGNIYYNGNHSPGQVLRNCVHPDIGKHILDCALNKYKDNQIYNGTLFEGI